jgi:hypothetical protein
MDDTKKLMQLLNDIDSLEDFIKTLCMDRITPKLDAQSGSEVLRLITEMKDRALK